MARLNEGESAEGPRFSLLPEEMTSDTVVCTLDWLKETVQTPEGLEQAFDLIMAVTVVEVIAFTATPSGQKGTKFRLRSKLLSYYIYLRPQHQNYDNGNYSRKE
jgi:hypothetical protein